MEEEGITFFLVDDHLALGDQPHNGGILMSVNNGIDTNLSVRDDDGYETPALREYGAIEEWTQGQMAQAITISLVI